VRQLGYKQVSLTPEAHQALREMKWAFSDTLGEDVTLSQAVLIAQFCYKRLASDEEVIAAGQHIGIEPPNHPIAVEQAGGCGRTVNECRVCEGQDCPVDNRVG